MAEVLRELRDTERCRIHCHYGNSRGSREFHSIRWGAKIIFDPGHNLPEEAVLYSFYDRQDKIMHWSCCMEEHPASGGSYFQTALKLNRNKGRLSSKKFLLERFGISVHFSAFTEIISVPGNM